MINPNNYKETFIKDQLLFYVGDFEKDRIYHLRAAKVFEVFEKKVLIQIADKRGEFGEGIHITKVNINKLFINKEEAIYKATKQGEMLIERWQKWIDKEKVEIERITTSLI